MKVAYFHVAADVPDVSNPDAAVVIDVLRATTTIACALHNGAEAVATFSDVNELKRKAMEWPQNSRVLLGERGGKRIDGFDLGNSPVKVCPEMVGGKRIFMSTTNGTRSLQRVQDAPSLYTMALPNRLAVVDQLLRDLPSTLWIVGSGWEGSYSLEDSLAAGSLVDLLIDRASVDLSVFNDDLNASLALWTNKVCKRSSDNFYQKSH